MQVYLLTVAYDGTPFGGWQRQPNAPTVQAVLEQALGRQVGEAIRVVGSSRTDAGVHARAQAAHFESTRPHALAGLVHGTNAHLPAEVRVMAARRMREGFNARRCALEKEYRYSLIRAPVLSPLEARYAVRAPRRLDLEAMRAATARLIGRHDFSAFAKVGGAHRQSWRTLFRAEWVEDGVRLELVLVGDGFLRGMVRALVGTLLEVGRGRRAPEQLEALLRGGERGDAGPAAPARGLVLERVVFAPEWEHEEGGEGRTDQGPVIGSATVMGTGGGR
jgi:tRNA pseudouridine38-40 synthase